MEKGDDEVSKKRTSRNDQKSFDYWNDDPVIKIPEPGGEISKVEISF